jgi:hypothetical protein
MVTASSLLNVKIGMLPKPTSSTSFLVVIKTYEDEKYGTEKVLKWCNYGDKLMIKGKYDQLVNEINITMQKDV